MPYSQNWMVGIQRQLRGNVMVEINYVGSKGSRLLRVVDGNPPQPALVAQLEAQGVPQADLQFDNLYFLGAANNTAFLHTDSFTSVGSSIYNALQMNVTKRVSQGLFLQAAYTWGHAIDNSSDPLVPTAGGETFPRNSFNLAAERGNSDFDVRQHLTLNYTWEIPLGPGTSTSAKEP